VCLHVSGGSGSKDADTSWKAYLLLWAALIKGGGLPKQDAALGSQLHLWSQPLYDALLTAVLDALRNLDLEYHQAADVPDVPDSHTAPLEITDQVPTMIQTRRVGNCRRNPFWALI
jgi:hypothetical protein